MEKRIEIVGEQVLDQSGSYRRVRRWIRGWHPELGTLMMGYTGPETVMDVDVICPLGTFYVHEAPSLPSPVDTNLPQNAASKPPLSDSAHAQSADASSPVEHEIRHPPVAA